MQRSCGSCGRDYEAKRPNSRYCGDTCRKRAQRGGGSAESSPGVGATVEATRLALEAAGRDGSYLGALALTLAQRIDETPGSGAASLGRELRATMEDALRGVKVSGDALDELKARRDRKLNAG